MTRTMHADGATGKVFIYNNDAAPSVYATPTATQLADLHFHSDLSYLGNTQAITAVVSHPKRTRSSSTSKGDTFYNPLQGSQTYNLGANTLGAAVPFIGFYSGAQVPSGTVVHQLGQSVRAVSIYVTSTNVYLYEQWVTFDDTLPAVSRTYKIFLFQTLFTAAGTTSIHIEPGSFHAGFGKLSTDYRYLREKAVSPDFYVGASPVADVQGGGLKVVLSNGGVAYNASTYTGAFTGSGGTGVAI